MGAISQQDAGWNHMLHFRGGNFEMEKSDINQILIYQSIWLIKQREGIWAAALSIARNNEHPDAFQL